MRRVELAAAAGLALNTVRNYEDGRTEDPSLHALRRIAEALDVDVLWLIDGDRVGEEVA